PLYRWRRVLIVALGIGLVTGGLYAAGRDPVGWAKARWYDARGSLVAVDNITYLAEPVGSTASGYSVEALGSPEAVGWATAWKASAVAPVKGCEGQRAAIGTVRLTLPEPARVRRLDVMAGLGANDSNRPLQFRPRRILVVYDGGCVPLDLRDDSSVQRFDIDTRQPVSALTLAIAAAYPARPDAAQNLVALSGVTVYTRPH
ncbi:MAG TPA: hypothetical protein VGJ44_16370, partial [Kribbellaceae bacterium]